ncbi:helix-turn-helix domain-containing protein [Actinomadura litoris]|uniref:helix-turn-helix domain-containing protein n=1 Tax=Actinomadura litoris TaxID=2678616 RepID=UPI001FA76639|nr:helix-turn-helix transcriptional regulator [Actinomadura litoris]
MASRYTNGASIHALRKALGQRQDSLAAQAGITASYLSRIEKGTQQPELEVTRRLADQLGVKLEAITYPVPEPALAGDS